MPHEAADHSFVAVDMTAIGDAEKKAHPGENGDRVGGAVRAAAAATGEASQVVESLLLNRAASALWHGEPDPDLPRAQRIRAFIDRRRKLGKKVLHSVLFQIFITVAVVADLAMTVSSAGMPLEEQAYEFRSTTVYAVVVLILFAESLLRVFVQGFQFLKSAMNLIEGFAIWFAVALLIVGRTLESMSMTGTRIVRPIVRLLRLFRVVLLVWRRGNQIKHTAHQLLEDRIRELLHQMLEHFVRVRPENVHIDPRMGVIHLSKLQFVRHGRRLHVPVEFRGGLLHEVYMKVDVPEVDGLLHTTSTDATGALGCARRCRARWRRWKTSKAGKPTEPQAPRRCQIKVRDAVLVVGPSASVEWHDLESIIERKDNLVHFFQDLLRPILESPEWDAFKGLKNSDDNAERSAMQVVGTVMDASKWIEKWVERWLKAELHSKFMQGAEVTISNIVVQYEELGGGPPGAAEYAAGFKLGHLGLSIADLSLPRIQDAPNAGASMSRVTMHTIRTRHVSSSPRRMRNADVISRGMTFTASLERVSFWVHMRPTPLFLYTGFFDEDKMQLALHQLKLADCKERLKVALASRREQGDDDDAVDAVRTRLYRKDVFQQHPYVLQPLWALATFPLPSMLSSDDGDHDEVVVQFRPIPSEMRHFKVSFAPVVVNFDSEQVGCINHMLQYYTNWQQRDRALRLRPERTIASVASGESRLLRRSVIRQWWLHALVLVQDHVCTPTRHIAALVELNTRAGRRVEYRNLAAKVMSQRQQLRSSWRSGPMRASNALKRCLFMDKGEGEGSDPILLDGMRKLHARMSIHDILRSQLEAHINTDVMTLESYTPDCQQRADEINEEDMVAIDSNQSQRGSQSVRLAMLHSVDMVQGKFVLQKALRESRQNIKALGITISDLLPTGATAELTNVEVNLFLVHRRAWGDNRSRPPYVHARGSRHALFRAWICEAECELTTGTLAELGLTTGITKVSAEVFSAGAAYCALSTGVERAAAVFHQGGKAAEDEACAVRLVLHRQDRPWLLRTGGDITDATISWRSFLETCLDRAAGFAPKKSGTAAFRMVPSWRGQILLRPSVLVVDAVPLVLILAEFGGALADMLIARFRQTIFAEAVWHYMPALQPAHVKDSEDREVQKGRVRRHREHRTRQRLTELALGLSNEFSIDVSLDITFLGTEIRLLQPLWSSGHWTDWLNGVRGAGRLTGPYHISGLPAQTVELSVSIPASPMVRLTRTRNPPMISMEVVGVINPEDASPGFGSFRSDSDGCDGDFEPPLVPSDSDLAIPDHIAQLLQGTRPPSIDELVLPDDDGADRGGYCIRDRAPWNVGPLVWSSTVRCLVQSYSSHGYDLAGAPVVKMGVSKSPP